MRLRRASADDADEVAEVWLRSRRANAGPIPPPVHDDDDVRRYFRQVVLADQDGRDEWDVRVAVDDARIVALMAMRPGWIEHLYVAPEWTGRGIGSELLAEAKRTGPLDLWTFQANAGARRFYERHGFSAVAFTEGDNEEEAPDVRYHWSPETA